MRLETMLAMKGIVKRFGNVVANDHVDFEVRRGEIHGLLGENGAGKTTLMNILFGLYQPDEGEIFFEGRKVEFKCPRDAISAGIGMVHQHFMLVPKMTVLHNLILGYRTPSDPLIDEKWVERRVDSLSERYGITIPLYEKIMNLSVGEEQRVEILKALFRDVRLLILDEPTAVLTPPEVQSLFSALKSMTEEGLTVIFITHKLKEALSITDRITVLRRGKKVGTVETAETNERELAKMMVGREVVMRVKKPSVKIGDEVLRVHDLWVKNDRGLFAVKGVSFTIREGEILGIAGVSGNGQRELEEAIAGIRKIHKGKVYLRNREITKSGGRDEIAHIPEDRIGVGLAPSLTVMENLMLKDFRKYRRGLSLDFGEMEKVAERLVEEFSVKTPSVHVPASTLSGGNIQRLILAREFSRKPRLIVASQPTRGLDVAGIEYVRNRLLDSAKKGCAILLISEDLDEIFQLSDRIAVMYEGEIKGMFSREEASYETVGYLMAGGSAGPEEVVA